MPKELQFIRVPKTSKMLLAAYSGQTHMRKRSALRIEQCGKASPNHALGLTGGGGPECLFSLSIK